MPPTLCRLWVDFGLHVGARTGSFRHFGFHFQTAEETCDPHWCSHKCVFVLLVDFKCTFGVHVLARCVCPVVLPRNVAELRCLLNHNVLLFALPNLAAQCGFQMSLHCT